MNTDKISFGFDGSVSNEEVPFDMVPLGGATDAEIEDFVARVKASDYVTNRTTTPVTDRQVVKFGVEYM